LKPREKLPGERGLAEYFNVGRSTVRTALKFLAFFEIVEIKVGKGVYITDITNRSATMFNVINLLELETENPLEDLINARKTIESQMAALAARNANDLDLNNMEKALLEMEEEIKENGKGVKSTNKFHVAIYKASKNTVLYKIGIYIYELMYESRNYSLGGNRSLDSLKEHKEILKAIKEKDEAKAYKLMNEHLENVEVILRTKGII
jgi:GntR family transcriptional repressor for pyruvate dehydrogenase complex